MPPTSLQHLRFSFNILLPTTLLTYLPISTTISLYQLLTIFDHHLSNFAPPRHHLDDTTSPRKFIRYGLFLLVLSCFNQTFLPSLYFILYPFFFHLSPFYHFRIFGVSNRLSFCPPSHNKASFTSHLQTVKPFTNLLCTWHRIHAEMGLNRKFRGVLWKYLLSS